MSGTQQFYLGAQDASSNTTDENSIEFIVHRLMNRRTHVELVQIVKTPYDSNGNAIPVGSTMAIGKVDVLPLVNQIDGFGNARPHDTVVGLNYFRHAGGGNAVIIDPGMSDIGIAVIADKDTSVVKSTGAQGNPGSRGRSRREYGIYIGLCVGAANPSQLIAFTENGITISDKNGNSIVMGPNGITISDKNHNIIAMASGGVTTTVSSGNHIDETAGGTLSPVGTVAGTSPVARADG